MARVVDSYSNILTVKLFARPSDEDQHVREVITAHQGSMAGHMRMVTRFIWTLWLMN